MKRKKRTARGNPHVRFHSWNTTDVEEILRRRIRGETEPIAIEPLEERHPYYGTFSAQSRSGRKYCVEIRSLDTLQNSCTCPDYMVNGLGTCKHIEAVLTRLRQGGARAFASAARGGSPRIEVYVAPGAARTITVAWPAHTGQAARRLVEPFFSGDATLLASPETAVPALASALDAAPAAVRSQVRIARAVHELAACLRRRADCSAARERFMRDLGEGKRSLDILRQPLFNYQRDGMLHLAFNQRALLADDMGLGKTVQAVAACALLNRLKRAERVLVVAPVSVKAEWEEQIARFSGLPVRIIPTGRAARLEAYRQPSFFYLANYEQILRDAADINRLLAPDVVILDEAQRIKNWQTRTADAVKSLQSPYAFMLTGTPLENRIEEIYSIFQFLDPHVFGPLFKFNRDFYEFDEDGRPTSLRNLAELRSRIKPFILRRRKEDILDELPGRTVKNYFVAMEPEQKKRYAEYSDLVARLLAVAKRRPLRPEEFDRLQKLLACMRMLCDTPYILDSKCRICPKLDEVSSILQDSLEQADVKLLVFSEWTRMLDLVAEVLDKRRVPYALHTGSVHQAKRRLEIQRFKTDPKCRVFLTSDAGSTGLNLQAASVVINLDLPWNPARLEQRIARAWRKHQTRHVHVINLVTSDSIEHRMIATLVMKRMLSHGIFDGAEDIETADLPSGRAAFIERLESVMGVSLDAALGERAPAPPKALPAPAAPPHEAFRDALVARMPDRVLLLEARWKGDGSCTMFAVVDGASEQLQPVAERLLRERYAGGQHVPALEMVDRATYDTIQRLICAGVLARGAAFDRVEPLHAHDALSAGRQAERERIVTEARSMIAGADRNARMGSVLASGGFPAEALPPLAKAVEATLEALLLLETGTRCEGGATLQAIEARLVGTHVLPDTSLAGLARMREAVATPPQPEAATAVVASCTGLLQHAMEAVNKHLLSG